MRNKFKWNHVSFTLRTKHDGTTNQVNNNVKQVNLIIKLFT